MTVLDIYKKYRIHRGLQMHQFRVAAVAKMVIDALGETVDSESIVLACLFHDMGNIIKSDLTTFPELIEPEGIEYWQKVKDEFVSKYGSDEHEATLAIMSDIGLSGASIQLVHDMGFSHSAEILEQGSRELQICEYADMRVGPYGVLSLHDRLDEGRKRYLKKHGVSDTVFNEDFDINARALEEIEQRLFEGSNMRPQNISDVSVEPIFKILKQREV